MRRGPRETVMTKIVLAAIATVFAFSVTAPAFAKPKAAPGKCGTYMFYDKKTKKCKDKRG